MAVDERARLDVVVKTGGRLPLLRDCLARRGLADMIEARCPWAAQAERSGGTVAERLVANRWQAPTPVSKVEKWAQAVGGAEGLRIPAALRTEARLGRVVEPLGRHAPVLKGEMAWHLAKAFHLGVEHLPWDLTTLALEGADEEQQAKAATAVAGRQSTYAKAGQARAKTASKVGLHGAHDGEGPIPLYDEPWAGKASGDQVTLGTITPLKQQLTREGLMRVNERGGQRAKMIAHSLAPGFDPMAPLPWQTPLEPLVRAALAAGRVLTPLASLPVSQPQQEPSAREGSRAFELP